MKHSEKGIARRVKAAMEYLELAVGEIDSINKEDRTEFTDVLLNEAADIIFDAKEKLKKMNTDYYSSDYNGENVRVHMRHRKKKCQS